MQILRWLKITTGPKQYLFTNLKLIMNMFNKRLIHFNSTKIKPLLYQVIIKGGGGGGGIKAFHLLSIMSRQTNICWNIELWCKFRKSFVHQCQKRQSGIFEFSLRKNRIQIFQYYCTIFAMTYQIHFPNINITFAIINKLKISSVLRIRPRTSDHLV